MSVDKKIAISVSLIVTLILISASSYSQLSVSCDPGGPYIKGSVVNVRGNVTDAGVPSTATVTTNITQLGSIKANRSASADADGSFIETFSDTLDAGTYTLNVTAAKGSDRATCNRTIEIKLESKTITCAFKTVTVTGVALYTSTGNLIPNGNVTMSFDDAVQTRNATIFNNGIFSVSANPCVISGKPYTITVTVSDTANQRNSVDLFYIG